MWATALTIATLTSLLAALGYVALAARKLDARLGTLLAEQGGERRRMQREVNRIRATTSPGC
jgi:hypothetical protein